MMNTDNLLDAIINLPQDAFEEWFEANTQRAREHFKMELVQACKAKAQEMSYGDDPDGALPILDRAALVAGALKQPLALALVWRGRANILQVHERYVESLAASSRAIALYKQYGTPYDVAVASTVEIKTKGALERFDEAINLALWIRPLFVRQAFTFGVARVTGNLAEVLTWAWRLEEALPEYERARKLYLQSSSPLDAARVLHNMGVLANRMDQLDLAQRYYSQAYPEFKAAGDVISMIKTKFNLARVCLRQGRYETALAHLAEARTILADLPDSPDSGNVDMLEAQVRWRLNQRTQAERLLREALGLFNQLSRRLEAAETLIVLGHLLAAVRTAEKLAEGLSCLEQAEKNLQALKVPLFVAWVQLEEAELLLLLERTEEAATQAQAARSVFTEASLHLREAQASALLADCCWRIEPQRARELYQAAIQVGEADPLLTIRCWRGVGRLAQAAHEPAEAEQAYERAVRLLENLRRSLRHYQNQAGFLEDKQGLTEALLNSLHLQPERQQDILAWIERFKAAALADLLVGQAADETIEATLRSLLTEREQLAEKLDRQLSTLHTNSSTQMASSLQRGTALAAHDAYQSQSLSEIRQQLLALDEQIVRRQDSTTAWREGVAIEPERIHDLLDEETLLISYYTVKGKLYALTVTNLAGDIQIHPLRVGLGEVEKFWQRTRRQVVRPKSNIAAIQKRLAYLWGKLIAPFEARIRRKKRLLILPHRSLFHLPFAALYDARRKRYLIERWIVQLAPSATILAWCQQRPSAGASCHSLLVGYPGEPLKPAYLPAVEQELAAVANLLPHTSVLFGKDATAQKLMKQAPGHAILHIAGHAYYNSSTPLESGMPLAGGRWLRASDLYLRYGHISGATVVLSGCETARGRPTGGDILGLTSAFLYAGAVGIVAGLWRIDDNATATLMVAFYRHLADGADTANALRQAQLTLLKSKSYQAPYFWAPFGLSGDSRVLK